MATRRSESSRRTLLWTAAVASGFREAISLRSLGRVTGAYPGLSQVNAPGHP